jgi:hypothetical protein
MDKKTKECIKSMEEFRGLAEKTIELIRELGLSEDLGEAIQELGLIMNIGKALQEYASFKEEQVKKR